MNESLREVIAEELEEIGDERLELVTITGIDVDADFRQATVFFSSLVANDRNANAKEEIADAFDQYRVRLQGAIGRQVRLKRTPLLVFRVDPAIEEGAKIDGIIRTLPVVGTVSDDVLSDDVLSDDDVSEDVPSGQFEGEPE